ncbi:MAG: hypothetical protein ABIC36_02155 [bacterium]
MLWLNKKTIKDISIDEYVRLIQRHFCINKILQYSKKSCVCLTSNNTVVKILNPDLSKYQYKNFMLANTLLSKCGIKTPCNLSNKIIGEFCIIENEYISPRFFLDKISLSRADRLFFDFFNQISKKTRTRFGPLIHREFLPRIFTDLNYIEYWDIQFEHFFKKISNLVFADRIKKNYKQLRKRIKTPNEFILSHSDISPKHVFAYDSNLGCIDLEEVFYLDKSFMGALWYVRTIYKRNKTNSKEFYSKFRQHRFNPDLFNFHFYRELFIQYYYQDLLSHFLRDYLKFSRWYLTNSN